MGKRKSESKVYLTRKPWHRAIGFKLIMSRGSTCQSVNYSSYQFVMAVMSDIDW